MLQATHLTRQVNDSNYHMDTKQPKCSESRRVRTRNAAITRKRILDAAYKEFSTKGYDGARIDAIVSRCKISKNLLYHYFAGKEALFIEVMELAYGAMRKQQNEMALNGADPIRDMRELVTQTVLYFQKHPEFLQLLSSENLHRARHIRKSAKINNMFNPLRNTLDNILKKGKEQGVFRQDADWVELYVSISGLGSYSITNRYTLSYVLGVDLDAKERVESRIDHICDMVIGYLTSGL